MTRLVSRLVLNAFHLGCMPVLLKKKEKSEIEDGRGCLIQVERIRSCDQDWFWRRGGKGDGGFRNCYIYFHILLNRIIISSINFFNFFLCLFLILVFLKINFG